MPEDWDELFRVVQTNRLSTHSLEEAFGNLFRYATPRQVQTLHQYLEHCGKRGNIGCIRIEARYHLLAAAAGREQQGFNEDQSVHLTKCIEVSKRGANVGDSQSMVLLASGLLLGQKAGNSRNTQEARRWLERAISLGNTDAKALLGSIRDE